MNTSAKLALVASAALLSACSTLGGGSEYGPSDYSLVRVYRVQVGDGSLSVAPPRSWNRHRSGLIEDIREVEDWTLNGPLLDSISFVTGLPNGRERSVAGDRRSRGRSRPASRARGRRAYRACGARPRRRRARSL